MRGDTRFPNREDLEMRSTETTTTHGGILNDVA